MYCKILSKVITETKRNNYNSQITESNNNIKTTWEIVKVESGKKTNNEDVQVLNIDGKATNDQQATASAFNEYFLSLVEKIYLNNNNTNSVTYSGSISQWNFIALKIHYTTVNYNTSNTRPTSAGSITHVRTLQVLFHNCSNCL
jgi:hypothetical protein